MNPKEMSAHMKEVHGWRAGDADTRTQFGRDYVQVSHERYYPDCTVFKEAVETQRALNEAMLNRKLARALIKDLKSDYPDLDFDYVLERVLYIRGGGEPEGIIDLFIDSVIKEAVQ